MIYRVNREIRTNDSRRGTNHYTSWHHCKDKRMERTKDILKEESVRPADWGSPGGPAVWCRLQPRV